MATITEIPYEIWDHILGYNNHKDTKNMACCSRSLYTLLKPMIWQKVSIRYPYCGGSLKREDEYLQNLRYTEELQLASSLEIVRHSEDVSKFAQYTLYLGKLLSFFQRGKLRKLTVWKAPERNCFSFTIEQLNYIRSLNLMTVSLTDWSSLRCLRNLELFVLSDCNISEDIFKAVLGSNKLEKLVANRCRFVTNHCFDCKENFQTIKTFIFCFNGLLNETANVALDATHLICFESVSCLSLGGILMSDESLSWIFENLKAVESLKLMKISGVSDQGFQSIQCSTNLRTLDIEHCDQLSDGLFQHIESSTSIRSLHFDAKLCRREHSTLELSTLNINLTVLNKARNLQEIDIRINNDIDDYGRRVAVTLWAGVDRAGDGLLTYILDVMCGSSNWSLKARHGMTSRVYRLCRC